MEVRECPNPRAPDIRANILTPPRRFLFFGTVKETMETIHRVIEWCATGIELLAVAVMVTGVVVVMLTRGTLRLLFHPGEAEVGERYKQQLGNTLLLGLELLVAADVIRTVALEPTLVNVAVLGLLVFVRTFLSWSLVVEMEGRWPWQSHGEEDSH